MEEPLRIEYEEVKDLLQSRNKQIQDIAAMIEEKRDQIDATKKKHDLLCDAKTDILNNIEIKKSEIESVRKEKEKLFAKVMKLERESKQLLEQVELDHYDNEIDDLQRRLSSLHVDPQKEDIKQSESQVQARGVSTVSTEVEPQEHKERLPSISEKPSLQNTATMEEHDPITAKLLNGSSVSQSVPELKLDDDEQFGLSGYQYEPVFDDNDDDEDD